MHPMQKGIVQLSRNFSATWKQHSGLTPFGQDLQKKSWRALVKYALIPQDVKADEQLHEKIALIQQFIRPKNLDIKPLAQKELQKINMYKAPRDKLVCILNCCKVINHLLIKASTASNEYHPGADEFLQ